MRAFPEALRLLRPASPAAPVPATYLRSLEVALGATLPREYKLLLEKVGLPALPGEPAIEFYDPATICAYAGSVFNLEEAPPTSWAAVPLARVGPHGDDLGLLRDSDTFGSTVYLLDHERYWRAGVEGWCEAQAESVTALVVARLQPTAEA